MNFLLNHYFGEGPGIAKDAPKPTGLRLLLATFAREWWDLLKLNLLFVAFALPVVTIPAAYAAAVRVSVMMIEDRNVYLWRDFWTAFRARFRLTTAIGVAVAGIVALGAAPSNSLSMVLRQGFTSILIGLALGLAGALGLSRLVARLLFGVAPTDPLCFVGAVAVLAVAGLAACLVPARRAIAIEPMRALRAE